MCKEYTFNYDFNSFSRLFAWAAIYSDTGYELHKNRSRFESLEFNAKFLGFGAAIDYALDLGLELEDY